ncbi:MAG TPA: undecaprenyldiphospho-muramoylpentapeptide beta-N-acetylglucosaminyltransferase [Acidimicrobiales bacterium]|jgi:undecaprenyldiphospho-muramoylpentapeptide beta-N-acetylglucosaminyltransferase|nr:undecaprenyldiphospho-muramoylpentapeptide beta-N-acetylglucosaminyltransferase [Acidimicrobiales bacterium]
MRKAPESGTWALIAGGGTAGHVLPGLALARALVGAGHDPGTIHWMGSAVGIEARLVPEAGFGVTLLPGRGVERRLSRASAAAAWGLVRAAATALTDMRRRRPAVVVALGGYASAPGSLAAIVCRVPLVLCEQNAVPGAANRLFGRFARAAAVSFPGTGLPRATLTGNPVRAELLAVDRARDGADARRALGLPADRTVVVSFGGSLGSRRINQAILGALRPWAARHDLAVRHVVGRRDWAMISQAVPPLPPGGLVYQPVEYENRMDLLLAAADVAVCRAGGSVAELTAVGVPAVLVPLPGAPGDHQTANARHLVDAGAAVMVADAELDGPRLAAEVNALVDDGATLDAMAAAAARAAHRDAAEAVAALVTEHARRG